MDHPVKVNPRTTVELDSFTLVGIQRTIIQKDEIDPQTGQIGKAYEEYYGKQLHDKIPNRLHPMRTHCLYFGYSNAQNWQEMKYNMVLGEIVSDATNVPEGMVSVQVPAHRFCRFDCGPGSIPGVVIDAWQSLCQLTPEDFGGVRTHDYELEVYPEDQFDKNNLKFLLYIGIQ
ncbi:unnamed protein product [Paramecium pentaurelia]|uniref:AraC effector-binding domain-containing protein n=1 Tax=Paramecium pentaurelia TaxID=43138 RepID=A0A8S1UDT7_9CILI|nr:unnamed protein product [Paramecium pentaurelia]